MNGDGYPRPVQLKGRYVVRHRAVYALVKGDIPKGLWIDHACRDKRCLNPKHLRPATNKQNQENRSGAPVNSTSGVLGVSWNRQCRKWRVQVQHNGVDHYGGLFVELADAERRAVWLRNRLFTHNDGDRVAA